MSSLKRASLLALVALTLVLLPVGAAPAAEPGLKILECRPVSLGPDTEPEELWLHVEFPDRFEKAPLEVRLDGQPTGVQPWHDGGGSGVVTASCNLRPAASGRAVVEVRLGQGDRVLKASTTVDFASRGDAVLVDHFDEETLQEPADLRLRAWLLGKVSVRFNGEPVVARREGRDFTFKPAWRPGQNTLEVSGTRRDGSPLARAWRLGYLPSSRVPLGTTLVVPYGGPGSRSGPAYGLTVEGSALVLEKYLQVPSFEVNSGSLSPVEVFAARLKAAQVGPATLVYRCQPFFLDPWETTRTVQYEVVP